MDTIFTNSRNSKTSDSPKLLLNILDKINLKRSNKYVVLSNLSICYTPYTIKNICGNNKFKMSAPTWNEEFASPDRSYSVSDIQDYFEYMETYLQKYGKANNHSIKIYVKNRK